MAGLSDVNNTLQQILAGDERDREERRRQRLDELENTREQNALLERLVSGNVIGGNPPPRRGGGAGDVGRNSFLGGLLGGFGGTVGRGAGGIAALGLALPAFFGGLLAGSEGLSWLQDAAGLDYEGLKKAAVGFTDIIMAMNPASFAVIAGVMTAAAVGGTRGAKGLASMGLAISGFLGGLLAGDALFKGVSWIGYDLDFNGLKQAAVGFSDMIMAMNPASFAVLAGVMTASAVAGLRGAIGLASMGLAISGFLGGLLAGDLLFKGVSALGASLDFANIKTMLTGFSDSIAALTPAAVGALGAILAGGALVGYSPLKARSLARGLGAIGMSMAAIFGGLLAGDLIAEGVQAIGGNIDFANVKTMFAGFSDTITALTPMAVATLGGIMAGGAIVGHSPLKARSLARGLGAIGAGMIALFGGLLVGETLSEGASVLGANLDFTNIKTMFAGFSDSIGALDEKAITTLGVLLSAGGVFGAVTGKATKAKVVAGAGAIGASISAFFAGFALGDVAIDKMASDGSAIKKVVKNFGDAISSLDGTALTVLGSLIGAGGILGALTVATGGAAAAVFAGIPAIGASIAGFFVAFEGLAAVANIVGLDGSHTKTLMANFALAINELTGINIGNAEAIGNGLSSLSAGMAAFFAAEALGKTVSFFEGIGDKFKKGWNWIFGIEETEASKSPFAKMVEGLEPLNDLDPNLITQMDTFGGAINRFVTSFSAIQDLDSRKASTNLTKMITDIGGVIGLLDPLINGGRVTDGTENWLSELLGTGRGVIGNFGGGLKSLDMTKLNELSTGVNALRTALGVTTEPSGFVTSEVASGGMGNRLENLYVENLVAERMAASNIVVAPQQNNSGGNSYAGFNFETGDAYDLAEQRRIRALLVQ
jgi:hypothetical protein